MKVGVVGAGAMGSGIAQVALRNGHQVILADVTRIQTSCGFAVPLMTFDRHRDLLPKWASSKGAEGLRQYRGEKNRTSIDGLPTS